MLRPDWIIVAGSGLLPPGVFFDDIDSAVTINVAAADAMGEPLVIAFRTNRVEFPGRSLVFPIRFRVTDVSFGTAEDLRFAVTRDVQEAGRFIIQNIQNNM